MAPITIPNHRVEFQSHLMPDLAKNMLLAVLATPAKTSGQRTLARINLARQILEYDDVSIANLLNIATYRTTDMSTAGSLAEPWLDARPAISQALARSQGVLLGYGVSEPSGTARLHYRDQIAWLESQLLVSELPVWSVGTPPRHPSRWQRLTHREDGNRPFVDALAGFLVPVSFPEGCSPR